MGDDAKLEQAQRWSIQPHRWIAMGSTQALPDLNQGRDRARSTAASRNSGREIVAGMIGE